MRKPSTKPKGATSYKETSFGILPRSKLLKLELEGTKRGLDYLQELTLKDKTVNITPELICKLHDVSFGWIFPTWAGKYRKVQVTYSGKEAPSYFNLPELTTNLCLDLRERLAHLPESPSGDYIIEVTKLITWFQHKFVVIHPFLDYNGRVGRMLTVLVLIKLGLPAITIEIESKTDRSMYLDAMQEADNGNFLKLEDIISQAIRNSLEKS